MKKSEFQEIEKKYYESRERLQKIEKGNLVWLSICRGGDFDYHPAIVTNVNVDEAYVDVIDVSDRNQEKRYAGFLTESELIKESIGISRETIKDEYEKYSEIIQKLK